MPTLYPSWIEIPASDLDRALAFYRAVFGLTDTPIYDQPAMRIAVLLLSDKPLRAPGVSLVQSPDHTPNANGVQVNFFVETHADLAQTIARVQQHGGVVDRQIIDEGDGQHYITVLDSEGNRIALSSYEPIDEDEE